MRRAAVLEVSEFLTLGDVLAGLHRGMDDAGGHVRRVAAAREAHYDGKWLLRTSDLTLTAEDLAAAYKQALST